jgi:hypothetical protein
MMRDWEKPQIREVEFGAAMSCVCQCGANSGAGGGAGLEDKEVSSKTDAKV